MMIVDGAILNREADATMMIGGDPVAATTMTIIAIRDHPVVAAAGLATPKVIQKRRDVVGMTVNGLPRDLARAMRTTTIAEGRAAGKTSVAGLATPKGTRRPRAAAGKIRTTDQVAGLGTAKAIPKRPVEVGKIQTTGPVAGSGTVKVTLKRLVADGIILTMARAAGSAIRKDTPALPVGAGAKNPHAADAAQKMTGPVEAAANMRIK